MQVSYPDEHRKFMREARQLPKQLKNARDYYAYLRSKRENMEPAEYSSYKLFLDTYLGLVRPSFFVEERYLESIEE
jgi:hypothetical protein